MVDVPEVEPEESLKAATEELAAATELRSDDGAGGGGKNMTWWAVAGVFIVLLFVAGVMAALIVPGKQVTSPESGDDGDGGFFSLPQARDNKRQATNESGLSGRTCEDADRRPIGVMLASDVINRPVSGFAEADMVFELPVLVSGVTRLLAVYQCGRPDDIGSVRSARHDYLFLGEGVDAIVGHWGGSYHALNRIEVGEFNSINALTNPFAAYFRKDHLPPPYNGFTTYENLWNALQKLEYRQETTFQGYRFKDDADPDTRPGGGTLSIGWPGAFRVHYEYNPDSNRYERYWGGTRQVDGADKTTTVEPSVVAVMRAENVLAEGPGGYNDVAIEGEGVLEVYQDGQKIVGSWKKNELDKTDPVHFLDENGKNIVFTRGQVWVMAVEPDISVTWEATERVEPAATEVPEAP